jgi:3-oxoacyl-[acyl-carrier protein] reductase
MPQKVISVSSLCLSGLDAICGLKFIEISLIIIKRYWPRVCRFESLIKENTMDLKLSGKTFIVTGGSGGLGLATVKNLLAEGANVLVSGRTEEKFDSAKAALDIYNEQLMFFAGDNADASLPQKLKQAVAERWGQLDGLLVSVGGPPAGKVLDTDDETWRFAFESVFLGTIRMIRDLSVLISDGGAIALILATSAKEAASGIPISNGLRPGLALLAKSFADELGPRNIRVNALLPGLFATERSKRLFENRPPDLSSLSLQRIGDPDEFGRMATILLSPSASYITGAAIAIDGGLMKAL